MESQATRTDTTSVTRECQRLAELLHLDAVGVVSTASGRRRVAWWAAPGSAPLPARLEDILGGRVQGWIVSPAGRGAVFARMTPTSSIRSAAILKALGPSLVAATGGVVASAREADAPEASAPVAADPGAAELPPTGPDDAPASKTIELENVLALDGAVDAIRRVLGIPGATLVDLLEAVREAVAAEEIFFLSQRDDDVDVLAVPQGDWPRRIPDEVRAELAGHPLTEPIDDATARQLGVVLGVRGPLLAGAFCTQRGPMEAVIAGWHESPSLPPLAMRVLARLVGAGRAVIESRGETVDALMRKERTRWAYEIHDGLTQVVTTAILELQGLREQIEEDPQAAMLALDTKKAEMRQALEQLRIILFDLSPEAATGGGSDEPFAQSVEDVVKRWRLPAKVSVEGDVDVMPKPVLEAAYIVIRESLANAAKHSSSGNVAVRIHVSPAEMEVEVEDGGRGFATAAIAGNTGAGGAAGAGGAVATGRRAKHFGLEMMRRRVEEVEGTLDIESSPGRGTRVVARLPVRQQGEKP